MPSILKDESNNRFFYFYIRNFFSDLFVKPNENKNFISVYQTNLNFLFPIPPSQFVNTGAALYTVSVVHCEKQGARQFGYRECMYK